MTVKIDSKIVGFDVVDNNRVSKHSESKGDKKPGKETPPAATSTAGMNKPEIVHMHEKVERPEELAGTTYKLKPPEHVSDHALYITINDIVLNEGTEHELRRPFEIFVNSKNMDQFQWVVALTRIMSAVFRKGGDVTFLVEELHSVFDPRGGYWHKGRYVPSLIAEIGDVIEKHLIKIGMIEAPQLDEVQKKLIDAKRAEFELTPTPGPGDESNDEDSEFPPNAVLCNKCLAKAVVLLDGCMTCLSCGDSKCG